MAHNLSLIIGGMELNDPFHRYGHFEVDDIEGWWKAPSRKSRDSARPNADGDFGSIDYYESRYITIKGAFVARTPGDRWLGADLISGLLASGPAIMEIRVDSQVQWAVVKLVDNSDMDWTAYKLLEYTLQVKAVDPYKYGELQSINGSVATPAGLFHRGNASAWPVVTIPGGNSPGGYTLVLNGKSVVVTRPLTAGVPHAVDYKTGILRIGGTVVQGGFGTADFTPVKSGTKQNMSISVPSGAYPTFTAAVRDTYI